MGRHVRTWSHPRFCAHRAAPPLRPSPYRPCSPPAPPQQPERAQTPPQVAAAPAPPVLSSRQGNTLDDLAARLEACEKADIDLQVHWVRG